MESELKLNEETLSDGSKVYSVIILNLVEINCNSHHDADQLYDFLSNYNGICSIEKY